MKKAHVTAIDLPVVAVIPRLSKDEVRALAQMEVRTEFLMCLRIALRILQGRRLESCVDFGFILSVHFHRRFVPYLY